MLLMVSNTRTARLLTLVLLSVSFNATAAPSSISSIEICSAWGGLGTPRRDILAIRNVKGEFARDGKRVDPKLVRDLVTALKAPHIEKPDLGNLGVTQDWLRTQLATIEKEKRGAFSDALLTQKQLFDASFSDTNFLERILPDLFSYVRTDDYPSAQIEVKFEDGSRLKANSNSSYAFMIPWEINGAKDGQTYNAGISRALAALLRDNNVNKERLSGEGFLSELVDTVMSMIEPQWKMLGAEGRAGETLRTIRGAYSVKSADINPYHSQEFGVTWVVKGPHEINLHATLHKPTFPKNFSEELILLYDHNKVIGVDDFLKSSAQYENLALSVRWLNDYLREHPNANAWLYYVHQSSFSDHAMSTFALDMKARGREDLVEKVRALRTQIALVAIAGADWLVFPDRHMMLWRYTIPSGLLKWTVQDFAPGRCGDYQSNYGGCSGREVRPDGTLVPEGGPRDEACVAKYRAQHQMTMPPPDTLFDVMDHGRGGFIDREGKIIIPLCFETVGNFSEGLARFERDKSWGYIDATGKVIIEPKFPWAEDFREGLAWVQVAGEALAANAKWSLIDMTGKVVITSVYTRLMIHGDESAFHDGLAMIEVQGASAFPKNGYIDKAGQSVVPARFAFAYPFSDGLAAVTESESGDSGWGFIDKRGNWVIPPNFEWAYNFSEGLAPVNRKKNCGYIDRKGAYVLRPPVPAGEKDCATVWNDFSSGLSRWRFGNKFGFIDHSGKTVIQPRFDRTDGFSEGLAAVAVGNKWGYIDTAGKIVIVPRDLSQARAFHNGLAQVVTWDGRWGYIDKTGRYAWQPTRQGPY